MPRSIFFLLMCLTCLLGCDPAHTSHTLLDLPPQPLTQPAIAAAMKIVADTASELGFENGGMTSDATLSGPLQRFGRMYSPDPQKGLYRSISISTRKRPEKDQLELEIWEFLCSGETEYAKTVRLALHDRLVERFSPSAVHSSAK